MTRRTHPIPGRTADTRRTARLSLEALDGRDVPALLGLSLPVSVGLGVPVVSDLLPLNLGATVGPLDLNVSTAPASAAPAAGGLSLDLGRLVSLDVDLPLSAPDTIVVPPVTPTPTPTPPVVPPVIENPVQPVSPPVTTPPTTPVVQSPTVEPTTTPPIISAPSGRTDTPAVSSTPTIANTPTTPTTPATTGTGVTTLPSAPAASPTATASGAFAPPAPETAVPATVAAVVPLAEAGETEGVRFDSAPAPDAPLAGLASPDAATPDVPPTLVVPTPVPEVAPAPAESQPQPGSFPVAAAEVLNQFLMLDFTAAREQAQEVLDQLGSALPDADELLGDRGWWYAAALASLFAARRVVLARSRNVRRALPYKA